MVGDFGFGCDGSPHVYHSPAATPANDAGPIEKGSGRDRFTRTQDPALLHPCARGNLTGRGRIRSTEDPRIPPTDRGRKRASGPVDSELPYLLPHGAEEVQLPFFNGTSASNG